MNYLSLCSGIEAASVAWHPLGWNCVGVSEIEPFPCAVLAHRFPTVKNYGDMTKFTDWKIPDGTVDLLAAGTPCQSFSVAGLRQGLKDPRGNLMLTFLAIAASTRPRWIVWENVPGVLSSNGGKDFATFVTALGELGYGWAYRVLDAQWVRTHGHPRAVPQRRRRVFVVGCFGDATSAAKVLFELQSVSRNTAKGKAKRQVATPDVAACIRSDGDGGVHSSRREHLVVGALCAEMSKQVSNQMVNQEQLIPCWWDGGDVANTLTKQSANQRMPDKDNFEAVLQSSAGGSTVIQPLGVVAPKIVGQVDWRTTNNDAGQVSQTLKTDLAHQSGPCLAIAPPAVVCPTLTAHNDPSRSPQSSEITQQVAAVHASSMSVRRLTPNECERLQGFPDDFTLIPYRGKRAENCPDGARYKALGNSMAVNCMEWIGQRIDALHNAT